MQSQQRRLAAILFTDIVGYTAMMQRNEEEAVLIMKKYSSVLQKIVAGHAGQILNDYGDGSLCTFSSATEAVGCAVELQRQLQEEPKVPLRIGLHVGEIFFEDGKVMGDGVNIASRIQSVGQANTILFSSEINNKIKNRSEFNSVYLGKFEFQNVDDPVDVFALSNEGLTIPKKEEISGKLKVVQKKSPVKKIIMGSLLVVLLAIAVIFMIKPASKTTIADKDISIAVLYFDNMSGDPTQDYFSDGITEEIISRLSRLKGLKIKNRTSVVQYKNSNKPAKEIAEELGVKSILNGSIRKQGNKIVITSELIDGATNDNIWSEQYDKELKDIFEVQSDIAQQIAWKFQIDLSKDAQKGLVSSSTQNLEAYDLYLKASSLISARKGLGGVSEDRRKAIELLRKAIQLDPRFADAYALLSENYTFLALNANDPKHLLDSAVILAEKAIAIGPDREAGYTALAYEKRWEGSTDEQLKNLLKAQDIKPFSGISEIVEVYLKKKDYKNAYRWAKQAREYDPDEPEYHSAEALIYHDLALGDSLKSCINRAKRSKHESPLMMILELNYYSFTKQHEEYLELSKRLFAGDEKEFNLNMGLYHMIQRDWQKADSLLSVSSKPNDIDRGLVKIQLGRNEEGKRILETNIKSRSQFLGFSDMWHFSDISRCYAAMQDNRYIENYNKAVQRGLNNFYFFENDPFYDPVRDTPEFKNLRQHAAERNDKYRAELFEAIQEYVQMKK